MSGAEILLDRYRRLMAHANPFVVIPDVSAQNLNEKKPFLLHAIVTVTYFHDLPRQTTMVKQIMRDISERILINGEKSIDILQGIIVLVCWYVNLSNMLRDLRDLERLFNLELANDSFQPNTLLETLLT